MAFCKPRYEIFRDGNRIVTSAQAGTLIEALVTDAQKFCFPDPITPVTPCTITITDVDVVPTVEGYEWTISYTSTGALYQFLQIDSEAYILMDGSPFVFETADIPGTITLWASNDFTPQTEVDFCAFDFLGLRENEIFTDDEEEFTGTFTAVDCGAGVLTREVIYTSIGVTVTPGVGNAFTGVATDAGAGMFVVLNLCDGLPHSVDVYNIEPEPVVLGLRIVYDDIANANVVDPTNVAQWNTLFDLPTNGTPFTSAVVVGNQVTLVGGTITAMPTTYLLQALSFGTGIIEIEDQTASLEVTGTAMLYGNATVTATIPYTDTIGTSTFQDNADLVTVIATNATTVLGNAFQACASAVLIDIPACVNLGTAPSDNSVFVGCTNAALVLNIAAVNATNNAGGVHASIAALLIANPTATVNYI